MRIGIWILVLLTATLLTSCVTARKYEDMEAWKNRVQKEYTEAKASLDACRAESAQLKERLGEVDRKVTQQTTDLAEARQRYDDLDRTNRDLMTRYDRMLSQNQQMLESSSSDKQQLTSQLLLKEQELTRRERELQTLQNDLALRSQRVDELEAAIREKDAKTKAIQDVVKNALLGFSAADLSVTERNGKVYVSLSQNLLFPSGSKVINAAGKDAIGKLARVLKDNGDIAITVEGHTDTDGDAAFNWDLSVGRATSVVKVLTAAGLDPKRITAAGRGQYFPIAPNTTSEGKAQNRRTEIILTPRLDVLYQLIGE